MPRIELTPTAERRRSDRKNFFASVSIDRAAEAPAPGRALNISKGGIAVATDFTTPLQARCELSFVITVATRPVHAQRVGAVVRSSTFSLSRWGHGVHLGFEFDAAPLELVEAIGRYSAGSLGGTSPQ